MKTYTAEYRTHAEHGSCDIEAENPEQALQLARELYHTDPDTVSWGSFDMLQPLTDISILDKDENVLLEWADPDASLQLAAQDMLAALEYCDMAFADLEGSKRKGYIAHAIKLTRAAIAKAKGGAS